MHDERYRSLAISYRSGLPHRWEVIIEKAAQFRRSLLRTAGEFSEETNPLIRLSGIEDV